MLAAHDHQRQVSGFGNGLGDGNALFGGLVLAVGVSAFHMQADEIGTGHGGGTGSHLSGGAAAGVEFLQAGLGVGFQAGIGDLNADLGSVFDGGIERVEGQDVHTAELDGLLAGTDGNGSDGRGERLGLCFKSHVVDSS